MLTRRRFLGYGGAGVLALTAGCRPQNINGLLNQEAASSNLNLSLADRKKLKKLKNLLLGYPINMNTPSEDFFAWRQQLLDVGVGTFAYNNVGNPFKDSAIPFNNHDFERELILRFGKLHAFPSGNTWVFFQIVVLIAICMACIWGGLF